MAVKINKDILIEDTGVSLEQVETNKENIENLTPIVLFNGSTTGTITLSDSSANYSYIELYGVNDDGCYGSIKIANPNGKTCSFWLVGTANSTYAWCKITNYKISGTSISVSNYGNYQLGGGTSGTDHTNRITIFKVLGYK